MTPPMPPDEAARVLGLARGADAAEVQRAFVRLARSRHPDTLPSGADDATRRRAAADFDDLVRARATLLAEPVRTPAAYPPSAVRTSRPRGIGGSLVVLALLAFLLVALVTAQDALRGETVQPGPPGVVGP